MTMTASSIGSSIGNIYVSSGNTAVTFLSISNVTGNSQLLNIFVVPASTAKANTHTVVSNVAIASHDTFQFYDNNEKLLMESGAYIAAIGNNASALHAVISYTSI